jgi:predicted lipoprotein with Yx(FWY)xxD motif
MAATYRLPPRTAGTPHASRERQKVLRRGAALSGLAATAMLAAACGSSNGTAASSATSPKVAAAKTAVSTRNLTGIGTVLVNSSGMTIYTPKTPVETASSIKCTGSCLSFWLPVTTSSAHPDSSGLPGKLAAIHLSGGTTQLTYNGRPLYTFRLDTAAGQAHGNNYTDSFNGTTFHWQAVTANGKPAGAGAPAPATSSSSQGGGYGGY